MWRFEIETFALHAGIFLLSLVFVFDFTKDIVASYLALSRLGVTTASFVAYSVLRNVTETGVRKLLATWHYSLAMAFDVLIFGKLFLTLYGGNSVCDYIEEVVGTIIPCYHTEGFFERIPKVCICTIMIIFVSENTSFLIQALLEPKVYYEQKKSDDLESKGDGISL